MGSRPKCAMQCVSNRDPWVAPLYIVRLPMGHDDGRQMKRSGIKDDISNSKSMRTPDIAQKKEAEKLHARYVVRKRKNTQYKVHWLR